MWTLTNKQARPTDSSRMTAKRQGVGGRLGSGGIGQKGKGLMDMDNSVVIAGAGVCVVVLNGNEKKTQ